MDTPYAKWYRNTSIRTRLVSIKLCVLLFLSPLVVGQGRVSPTLASSGFSSNFISSTQTVEFQIQIPDLGITRPDIKPPSTLPSRLALVRGPEFRSDTGIDQNGRRGRFLTIVYTFRPLSTGYALLPPYLISANNQEWTTREALLGISADGSPERVPPDLSWRLRSTTVFEGQPLLATLELRYARTLDLPERIDVVPPLGGIFDEVAGAGSIETEILNGIDFKRIPIGVWLFTPSNRGSVTIPASRVSLGRSTLVSSPRQLTVTPLPPAVSASGAIGRFSFTANLSSAQTRPDEAVLLTLRVEGEGNLNYLRIPAPQFENLLVVGSAENSRYEASESGYRGFRELVYRLISSSPGIERIQIPEFVWLDPEQNMRRQEPSELTLRIDRNSSASTNNTVQTSLKLLETQGLGEYDLLPVTEGLVPVFLFVPGGILIIIGILLRIIKRRRSKQGQEGRFRRISTPSAFILLFMVLSINGHSPVYTQSTQSTQSTQEAQVDASARQANLRPTLDEAFDLYEQGRLQEALARYESALASNSKEPLLQYNKALIELSKGAYAKALHTLDRLRRNRPDLDFVAQAIQSIEAQYDLDRQHPTTALPRLDLVLLVLAFVFTLFGVVFLLSFRRFGPLQLVLSGILLLGLIGGSVLLGLHLNQTHQKLAFISEAGAVMRKIPDTQAAPWLNLVGGTSVELGVQTGDHFLVQTAFGIKGWVDKSALYYDL